MTSDPAQGSYAPDDELEPRLAPDHPRRATAEDRLRFEGYLAEILTALGLDLDVDSPQLRASSST